MDYGEGTLMMPIRLPSLEQQSEEAYNRTYHECAGHLNRKDRRTVKGRLIVAEAEIKALRAKIAVLEQENYDE